MRRATRPVLTSFWVVPPISGEKTWSAGKSEMAPEFLWGLLASTLGFSLLFGAVVLMRMRAILADQQAEARLRRRAMEAADA